MCWGVKVIRQILGVPAAVLVLAIAVSLSSPSVATTFVALDQEQLAEMSVAAVAGSVVEISSGREAVDGGIRTDIRIDVEDVLFGDVDDVVVVREMGGRVGDMEEWTYGTPVYRMGERVVVFLSENDDGTYRTTSMALGKFEVVDGEGGSLELVRDLGEGVQILESSGDLNRDPEPEITTLSETVRRQRRNRPASRRGSRVDPEPLLREEPRSEFTYLGSNPSRWFEPDTGEPIPFAVDHLGDPGPDLGPDQSVAAIHDAFDAWSEVSGSALEIVEEGVMPEPLPYSGCGGGNRIVFNDPFDEIADPNHCGGVLAIGGFCTSTEARTVHGSEFRRIRVGKVTFNNGWSNCLGWNRCSLSEVATHEIGHAIGLGHSSVPGAIMRASAYLDGRCTDLGDDDVDAVRFVYPAVPRTATPTPSTAPTATATLRPTRTSRRTATKTPTPTRTRTRTKSQTPTRTEVPVTPSEYDLSGRVRYFMSGEGIAGVDVAVGGASSSTMRTGGDGGFEFDGVARGEYVTITGTKAGGVGAALSSLDAAYALQAVVGSRELSGLQGFACDATGDGAITALDASRLLMKAIGAIPHLPVTERCGSDWLLVPSSTSGVISVPPMVSAAQCKPGAFVIPATDHDMSELTFDAVLLGDCSGGWSASEDAFAGERVRRRPRVRFGRLRVRGERASMKIYVRSRAPYQSLDVELLYDDSQIVPSTVDARDDGEASLLAQRTVRPGVLRIGFASSKPVTRRFAALLTVNFDLLKSLTRVSRVQPIVALIDESEARTSSNAQQR